MKVLAISAGMGQPSATRMLVDRLSAATVKHAGAAGLELDEPIEVIELRDIATELMSSEISRVPSPRVAGAIESVEAADTLIVVSPIYNTQPAALLSLFFEVADDAILRGKPVLLGATGGTARHSLAIDRALLPLFHYLHALVVPTSIFAATDDWGSPASLDKRTEDAAGSFVGLLAMRAGVPNTDELSGSDTDKASHGDDDFELENDFETMLKSI